VLISSNLLSFLIFIDIVMISMAFFILLDILWNMIKIEFL
jgi:hypothetical protein